MAVIYKKSDEDQPLPELPPELAPPQNGPLNAKDVIDCLKNRFAAPEWVFATELCLVPGFINNRRADAVAMNCFNSEPWGQAFVGFEVKVSRSDFLSELKHPEKRKETYVGCDALFLAVPKGLVKASEVPTDMGIVECWKTEGIKYARIKRQPPNLDKLPIPEAMGWDEKYGYKVLNIDNLRKVPRPLAVAILRSMDPTREQQNSHFKLYDLEQKLKDALYRNKLLRRELKRAYLETSFP